MRTSKVYIVIGDLFWYVYKTISTKSFRFGYIIGQGIRSVTAPCSIEFVLVLICCVYMSTLSKDKKQ